jgi:hypothetical protein
MSVYCECCALSGRGLCDELITRAEESCRLWRIIMSDLETSEMRRPLPALGCWARQRERERENRVPELRLQCNFGGLLSWSLFRNCFVVAIHFENVLNKQSIN